MRTRALLAVATVLTTATIYGCAFERKLYLEVGYEAKENVETCVKEDVEKRQ